MKKLRIRKIDVLSVGKVAGIIYLVIGVFLSLLISLVPTVGPGMMRAGYYGSMMYSGAAIILIPIIYGVVGFLGGVLGAFLYNTISSWIGPIELETD
ncbi:hypothetical protein HY500_00695 [Candidatus Woesearchaeota archaeon]|nr:hypothetical protein [Candidatus Woesearchaeota archaeon]